MDKEQALYAFWAGFNWPAYDEQTVPDEATLPYITYEDAVSGFNNDIALTADLWYRSREWSQITAKAKEIVAAIGRGGKLVQYKGGAFWIKLSTPNYTRTSDPSDDGVRRIKFNLTIEYFD